MIRLPTTTLSEFQTLAIMQMESRPADTYLRLVSVGGNSILSSLFVKSMAPGATLDLRYWDTTTGSETTEEYVIGAHLQVTPGMLGPKGYTDRQTFTKIHDKVFVEAIVSGGAVEFGVYNTIVSSFASDLDAALQAEPDPVDLANDLGLPVTVFETTDSTWRFLRALNGRLQVDVPGGIQTTQVMPNTRFYGHTPTALPAVVTTHVDYTVPVGKKFTWISGKATASTWTRWIVTIDGNRYAVARNAFDLPNVSLDVGGPLLLVAGQRIIVTAENLNPYSVTADIETFLFGREETA